MTRLLLIAALGLPACRGVPFPAHEPLADEARRLELISAMGEPSCGPTKMMQRVILEMGGEETSLTMYGRVLPPDGIGLVAVADLGGTLFAVWRSGAGARATTRSPHFSETFLKDELIEDEALAFLPPSRSSLTLVRLAGGELALLSRQGARDVLFRGSPDVRTLEAEAGVGGRSIASVRVTEWAADERGKRLHPRKIDIEGRRSGYRARIEVIRWEPMDAADPAEPGFDAAFRALEGEP